MKTLHLQLLSFIICYTHTHTHTVVTLGTLCFLKHNPLSCLGPYPNYNKTGFDNNNTNVINIWTVFWKGIAHIFHTFLLWALGGRQCKWHYLRRQSGWTCPRSPRAGFGLPAGAPGLRIPTPATSWWMHCLQDATGSYNPHIIFLSLYCKKLWMKNATSGNDPFKIATSFC